MKPTRAVSFSSEKLRESAASSIDATPGDGMLSDKDIWDVELTFEHIGIVYYPDGAKIYLGHSRPTFNNLLVMPDGKRFRAQFSYEWGKLECLPEDDSKKIDFNVPLVLSTYGYEEPTQYEDGTIDELYDFLVTAGNPESEYIHIGRGIKPEVAQMIIRGITECFDARLSQAIRLLMEDRNPALEDELLASGDLYEIYTYIRETINGRWPEAEPLLMNDAGWAYTYAREFIRGRWPGAEPEIMKYPRWAYYYALDIIKGRWPEAESTIMHDPISAYDYAFNVLQGRWPEAESTIMRDPHTACFYATHVIGDRWPEAEQTILKDPRRALSYAINVIGGRWPEAEPGILRDVDAASEYATDVIRKRWPEFEERYLKPVDSTGKLSDEDEWGDEENDPILNYRTYFDLK